MVIDPPMHGSIVWVNPDAINKIASPSHLDACIQVTASSTPRESRFPPICVFNTPRIGASRP